MITLKVTIAILFALLPCIFTVTAYSAHLHPEKWYQDKWCAENKGQSEVVLPDKTRADCITKSNVIEFDFAHKFYEAIGQSLYYSLQTGKKAGIVLIIENPGERKYWIRLNSTIQHFGLPIDTWVVGE